MSKRRLQALLSDLYLEAAVDLTRAVGAPGERRQTRNQRVSAMADNGGGPAVTTELLEHVKQLGKLSATSRICCE